MIRRLTILLLIVGCEETGVVAPLVCGEGLTDVNGECILVCDGAGAVDYPISSYIPL